MARILITGGAGFIGSHLADLHLAQGDHVEVVDDLSTGQRSNIAHNLNDVRYNFHCAPLMTWDGLDNAVKNAERIYHLAAIVGVKRVLENPVEVIETNQNALERILKSMVACKSKATILMASSSEVYGFSEAPAFKEDGMLVLPSKDPLRWCYAVTKLADEMLGFANHHQYGVKTVMARLFNTIGPRQCSHYGMVLPHFIEQAMNGETVTVYGEGNQSRSFCDVRDTVEILSRLAGSEEAYGKAVNAGNDREISIHALAEKVIALTGSHSRIKHIPYLEAYGMDFEDIQHRRPDLKLMVKLTGYTPRFTLDETIERIAGLHKRQAG